MLGIVEIPVKSGFGRIVSHLVDAAAPSLNGYRVFGGRFLDVDINLVSCLPDDELLLCSGDILEDGFGFLLVQNGRNGNGNPLNGNCGFFDFFLAACRYRQQGQSGCKELFHTHYQLSGLSRSPMESPFGP